MLKNKKFLVVIIIIFLILLIRQLLPMFKDKVIKNSIITKNDNLVCVKSTKDNYDIKITTKYKKDKVENIKMIFKYNLNKDEKKTDTYLILSFYSKLVGSTCSMIDNKTEIILNKETKDYYVNDELIKTLFSKYDKVKEYYESDGYNCK